MTESDQIIRAMRDAVYGRASTDTNWNGCRENWLKPDQTEWLRREYAKLKAVDPLHSKD